MAQYWLASWVIESPATFDDVSFMFLLGGAMVSYVELLAVGYSDFATAAIWATDAEFRGYPWGRLRALINRKRTS